MQAMMMAEGPVDASMRTLWMGDLAFWMDESFLYTLFAQTGELVSAKVIRNKLNGQSEGYGFLEFRTHEGADAVLRTYNGQPMPNSDQVFRLNWAAFGVGKASPEGTVGVSADHSIFVGDLAPDVTDFLLQEHFRQFFPSVRSAKVITDPGTGRSKGYGFVRFGSEPERDRALLEMNGQYLSSRPIRVSLATAKKATGSMMTSSHSAPAPSDLDPTNTTLFIGGLSASVTEDQLRSIFGRYGEIIYTKIPQGKGCGFVQFVDRKCAETAMGEMNGQVLGNSAVRISWGRSSSSKALPASGGLGGAGAGAFGAYNSGFAPSATNFTAFDQGYGGYPATFNPATTTTDPYSAAYSTYGQAYPNSSFNGMSQAGAAGVGGHAAGTVMGGAGVAQYDPLAPVDVDKINANYMQRHQPALLGTFLRAS